VEFVDSVELDSFRRDFTVNAIYYDIKEEEFIDYTGGVEDLKNKTLRAVREPDLVLNEDALRILRMVRLAASFDFKIDKNTLDSAKKNVDNLKNIAPERIRDEFDKIILADTIVGISRAHVKGVRMLTEIGAMKYIIPELLLGIGMDQRPDFHKYDVYNHILAVFEASPPEIRLAALLHDIAKPIQMQKNGNMYEHDKVGGEIAVKVMSTLRYSTKEISFVKKLVQNHMYDLNLAAKDSTIKKFIRKNEDIIPCLIELKKADRKGGGILQTESESAKRLKTIYEEMKKSGVPFNTKDLKVNGEDLIKLGIPPQHRSKALEALLDRGSYDYLVHSRDEALNFLKTFRDNL
jgi:tRNA nucleotidyltransferase (CCA-adding enzyme)